MGIKNEDFQKSLKKLEDLAKSQLFHTGSDSNPGEWAGSKSEDQDAFGDMIDENGTDYSGVKKALAAKSKATELTPAEKAIAKGQNPLSFIADKVAKGLELTKAEKWALKGGYATVKGLSKSDEKPGEAGTPGEAKDPSSVPDTHAGADDDEAPEAQAKKSLSEIATESEAIKGGIELSPFLAEFVNAMDLSLRNATSEVKTSVAKALAPVVARVEALEKSYAKSVADSVEFNKALAESIVGLGAHVQSTSQLTAEIASGPARAPKSQLRNIPTAQNVQVVQKSFGAESNDQMLKSDVITVMCELVKSNQLSSIDLIKYESTDEMSAQTRSKVLAALSGANR